MKSSDHIRQGIAAARERGVAWGAAGKIRAAQNAAVADEFANSLRQLIVEMMTVTRFPHRIAYRLNRMGVPTARGGYWRPTTVRRLIKRLGNLEESIAAAHKANAASWWQNRSMIFDQWRSLRGLSVDPR